MLNINWSFTAMEKYTLCECSGPSECENPCFHGSHLSELIQGSSIGGGSFVIMEMSDPMTLPSEHLHT